MKKFFACIFLPLSLFCTMPPDIVENTGMFGIVNCVLSLLSAYEKGTLDRVDIDFGDKGLFYEPDRGLNWWEYYYEPIHINKATDRSKPLQLRGLPIRKVNALLTQKYIKVKPHIHKKIKPFINLQYTGYFVIGIHYRGTDKKIESPRVSYDKFLRAVDQLVKKKKKYKIFVATDEAPFLEYIKKKYGNRVIFYPSMLRSNDEKPIHYSEKNHYRLGEEAIIDCILLSECNYLFKTQSNLSAFATFLNPNLPCQIIK